MSFGDDITEPEEHQARQREALTREERSLLAREQWSIDELVRIAFLARRLAAQLESTTP